MPSPDVTVTKDNPLTITDSNRSFGKVTVESGGQIWVQTLADISIDTLDIQPS